MAGDETLIDLDAEPGAAVARADRVRRLGRRAVRRGGDRLRPRTGRRDDPAPAARARRVRRRRRGVRRRRRRHAGAGDAPSSPRSRRRGCRRCPSGAALTSTWFCPGVPADGSEGSAGGVRAGQRRRRRRCRRASRCSPVRTRPSRCPSPSTRTLARRVDPSASVTAPFVGGDGRDRRRRRDRRAAGDAGRRHVRRPVHDADVAGVVPGRGVHGRGLPASSSC